MEYTLHRSAAASSSFSSLYCFNLNKDINISESLSWGISDVILRLHVCLSVCV